MSPETEDDLHFFQVTGDIVITGKSLMEAALRPSLLFLNGNMPRSLINKLVIQLSIDKTTQLKIPLNEDYAFKSGYGEYVVEYNKLYKTEFSDHTLKINIPELMVSLSCSKGTPKKEEVVNDNSDFLIDLFESALKTIKDQNEFS